MTKNDQTDTLSELIEQLRQDGTFLTGMQLDEQRVAAAAQLEELRRERDSLQLQLQDVATIGQQLQRERDELRARLRDTESHADHVAASLRYDLNLASRYRDEAQERAEHMERLALAYRDEMDRARNTAEVPHEMLAELREQREGLARRLAAVDCAAHGHWSGPPEVDGRPDPLLERVLELHEAWLAAFYTERTRESVSRVLFRMSTPVPTPALSTEPMDGWKQVEELIETARDVVSQAAGEHGLPVLLAATLGELGARLERLPR